ncbi:hypothetical protein BKA70DRAFT_1427628 [Coprinopsis sp. MPI-PUGE-AT-0042]|nr:hypothetical protein BKA70DRAFT_1427628 [Coprinopsis sp. MPI-PUGE-AT-0042]
MSPPRFEFCEDEETVLVSSKAKYKAQPSPVARLLFTDSISEGFQHKREAKNGQLTASEHQQLYRAVQEWFRVKCRRRKEDSDDKYGRVTARSLFIRHNKGSICQLQKDLYERAVKTPFPYSVSNKQNIPLPPLTTEDTEVLHSSNGYQQGVGHDAEEDEEGDLKPFDEDLADEEDQSAFAQSEGEGHTKGKMKVKQPATLGQKTSQLAFAFFQEAVSLAWKGQSQEERDEYHLRSRLISLRGLPAHDKRQNCERSLSSAAEKFAHYLWNHMGVKVVFSFCFEDTQGTLRVMHQDYNGGLGGTSFVDIHRSFLNECGLSEAFLAWSKRKFPAEGEEEVPVLPSRMKGSAHALMDLPINERGDPLLLDPHHPLVKQEQKWLAQLARSVMTIAYGRALGCSGRASVPWGDLERDTYLYISPEVIPEHLEAFVREPSNLSKAKLQSLLFHMWDRQQQGLAPIEFIGVKGPQGSVIQLVTAVANATTIRLERLAKSLHAAGASLTTKILAPKCDAVPPSGLTVPPPPQIQLSPNQLAIANVSLMQTSQRQPPSKAEAPEAPLPAANQHSDAPSVHTYTPPVSHASNSHEQPPAPTGAQSIQRDLRQADELMTRDTAFPDDEPMALHEIEPGVWATEPYPLQHPLAQSAVQQLQEASAQMRGRTLESLVQGTMREAGNTGDLANGDVKPPAKSRAQKGKKNQSQSSCKGTKESGRAPNCKESVKTSHQATEGAPSSPRATRPTGRQATSPPGNDSIHLATHPVVSSFFP